MAREERSELIMRDPDRIPKILKELEFIWRKIPDMRLGQLISAGSLDVFMVEDEQLMQKLHNMFDHFPDPAESKARIDIVEDEQYLDNYF